MLCIPKVAAPPNKEKHFDVDYDEKEDIGYHWHDEDEVTTLFRPKTTSEVIILCMWSTIRPKS